MITDKNYIHELELNFSNECGADCIMCSEAHGCGNIQHMPPDVWKVLANQLKDVKTDIIQTSGDGEVFKNPSYFNYVMDIKSLKPSTPMWIYNNFSMFNKDRVDYALGNKIFEKIHTRIDSLNPEIFAKSSGLDFNVVMENIKYFLSVNQTTPFVILYNNIKGYYDRCKAVTGKLPIKSRFTEYEISQVPDERGAINNFVKQYAKRPDLVAVCQINHGLWGERYRTDIPHNPNHPCPKMNVIEKVCWVYPNGNIGMCCYEDKQKEEFSLGNIMDTHILDIFYGAKRKTALANIKKNMYKDYPCNDPRMCGFGDGMEAK